MRRGPEAMDIGSIRQQGIEVLGIWEGTPSKPRDDNHGPASQPAFQVVGTGLTKSLTGSEIDLGN